MLGLLSWFDAAALSRTALYWRRKLAPGDFNRPVLAVVAGSDADWAIGIGQLRT
jgi:hypothetical protein